MAHTTLNPLFLAVAVLFLAFPAMATESAKPAAEPVASSTTKENQPSEQPLMTLPRGMVGSYLSSQFARTKGDLEKAVSYLRRAHKGDPKNASITGQLQALLLLSGQVHEAIKLAETVPVAGDETSLATMLLTIKHYKKGELAQARAVLDQAAKANSNQLWIPLVAAWIDIERQQFSQPLKLEHLNIDAARSAALVNYHLALINGRAGFIDAAAENFRQAIPDVKSPPARIMGMLQKFYQASNAPAALKPVIAAAVVEADDVAASSEDIAALFTPADGIAEILFTMGNVAQAAGASQDAVIYLHLTHYLKPEFPMVLLSLGEVYHELKQHEMSQQFYAAVKPKSLLYTKSQLRLISSLNHVGKTKEAFAELEKAIKAHPQHYEFFVAKGDLLRAQGKFLEAVDVYSQALKTGENEREKWMVYFARGVCFERLGQWQAAEGDLQKALSLKANQPDVLNYLGYSLLTRNERLEEAKAMIEKAVKAKPNDPQIIDSMGWALYALQQYEDAAAYLERALELLPGDPTINDHLGDVYWKLGRKTEARYQWERALTFEPESAEAARIQEKLKHGVSASDTAIIPSKAPVIASGEHKGLTIQ